MNVDAAQHLIEEKQVKVRENGTGRIILEPVRERKAKCITDQGERSEESLSLSPTHLTALSDCISSSPIQSLLLLSF